MLIGTAYVDGGGMMGRPSAAGVRLILPEFEIHAARSLGKYVTNNDAEYEAVILGLQIAHKHKVTHLQLYSDSQLIVNQLLGTWKMRGKKLEMHRERAWELGKSFEELTIDWVPRTENEVSDALCWEAKEYESGTTFERAIEDFPHEL